MKKMINLVEVMEETKKGMNDYSIDFCTDYMLPFCSSYFSDAISEFADGRTSIYYCDIEKYISENVDHVNNTISEFGWDDCGSTLYGAGQLAEYTDIQNQLYSDTENILTLAAADFIKETEGENVPADLWEAVEEAIVEPERIDDLFEAIKTAVDAWKEDGKGKDAVSGIVSAVAAVVSVDTEKKAVSAPALN